MEQGGRIRCIEVKTLKGRERNREWDALALVERQLAETRERKGEDVREMRTASRVLGEVIESLEE